jgi:hypothetical protein
MDVRIPQKGNYSAMKKKILLISMLKQNNQNSKANCLGIAGLVFIFIGVYKLFV